MLRVALKIVLAGAALAAVWAFVPVGGHTMAWRWSRCSSAAELVGRTWADVRGARSDPHARTPPHAQARNGSPAGRPTEGHTDADRKELDRILSRHLGEQ
jgi:hypothetical protein